MAAAETPAGIHPYVLFLVMPFDTESLCLLAERVVPHRNGRDIAAGR